MSGRPKALSILWFTCAGLAIGQLTMGTLEGVLHDSAGRPQPGASIVITGALHFHEEVHTDARGAFRAVLPYGEYQVVAQGMTKDVFVAALQTTDLELAPPRPLVYTESSLQSLLLTRGAVAVTAPLDFTGANDNRLTLISERAFSWTGTEYTLMGMNASDANQPGRPAIVANPSALDELHASGSPGARIDVFEKSAGASWHGMLSTYNTGFWLESSNLPPPAERGMVQQADRYRRFTRDTAQAGGPLTRWLDFAITGTAQWASQAAPLASPGTDYDSRILWGDARGRIRAGAHDQIDALYSGSRINLSNFGSPGAIEGLEALRMAPSFALPGGFPNESEVDHLDFLQIGWTHEFAADSKRGVLEVRYGYSTAHLDSSNISQTYQGTFDLLTGMISGAPPLRNLGIRPRQGFKGAWRPDVVEFAGVRHQFVFGAGWESSLPSNRYSIPSDINLITIGGAPALVEELNTPLYSRSLIRDFSAKAGDEINFVGGVTAAAGVEADLSRGSLPRQSSIIGGYNPARLFEARPDVIVWNSASPYVRLAWKIPRLNRVTLSGGWFRFVSPMAGHYLDFANPESLGGNVYQWIDRNGDGQFDKYADEAGTLLRRIGGPYSSISPSLRRPYADEFDLAAEYQSGRRFSVSVHLFRRDEKQRLAALDVGVPFSAFTPITLPDPLTGQPLTVYNQDAATLGQDQYVLTNPPGLREQYKGIWAEARGQWRSLFLDASFLAERSYGPTNPGDSAVENDPGFAGSLFMDPNTAQFAAGRDYMDRGYVAKLATAYRLPRRIDVTSVMDYIGGLPYAREALITGLNQGPILVPASPRGLPRGNQAGHVFNWNLRFSRDFKLHYGTLNAAVNLLNLTNAGNRIQENDISGTNFNLHLPIAIQEARTARLEVRYDF